MVAVKRIWDSPLMGKLSSSQIHNARDRNEGTPRHEDEELLHEEQVHPQTDLHTKEQEKCKKGGVAEKSCDILTQFLVLLTAALKGLTATAAVTRCKSGEVVRKTHIWSEARLEKGRQASP